MLWLVVMTGGVGFVLGLWFFRVHSVIAASAASFLICIGIALFAQWNLLASIGFTFAALSALQCAYLGGLLVSSAWGRARAPHTILRSSHIDQ